MQTPDRFARGIGPLAVDGALDSGGQSDCGRLGRELGNRAVAE